MFNNAFSNHGFLYVVASPSYMNVILAGMIDDYLYNRLKKIDLPKTPEESLNTTGCPSHRMEQLTQISIYWDLRNGINFQTL